MEKKVFWIRNDQERRVLALEERQDKMLRHAQLAEAWADEVEKVSQIEVKVKRSFFVFSMYWAMVRVRVLGTCYFTCCISHPFFVFWCVFFKVSREVRMKAISDLGRTLSIPGRGQQCVSGSRWLCYDINMRKGWRAENVW